MAERMQDNGGTKVEQADQERREPVEPMRRQTYRTLDEQQGKLSEAEERFERGRRTVGLFLGPLLLLVLLALPLDLEGKQQALAAVLGLVVIAAFGFIGAATSPFMSNTGAAAMMLPIASGIMASVGRLIVEQVEGEDRPERLRFGAALLLVITYGITVGGLLLPIGSPPNLIGRGLIQDETGEPITFFEWFLTALPIVLVMFVALIVVILFLNRPEVQRVEGVSEFIAEEKRKLGRLSPGERNTLIAFGVAVLLWTLPGLVGLVLGDDSDLYASLSERWLDEGVVAVVAAALLFGLPIDWGERRFTLNWNQAAPHRLGHDPAVRVRHRPGVAAARDRAGQDRRGGPGQHPERLQPHLDHHHQRGDRGDHLRDDQQHGQRGHRGPDRHRHLRSGRGRPGDPGPCRYLRGQLRLHAAGVDPAQRDRLQLRHAADHAHGQDRRGVRRDRRGPVRGRGGRAGQGGRPGLTPPDPSGDGGYAP
jgi:hypothetical protein